MNQEEIETSVSLICGKSIWARKFIFRFQEVLSVRAWHVKRELKKWLRTAPPQAHILDVGTGFGHFAYWLSCAKPEMSILAIDKLSDRICSGNSFVRELDRYNLLFKTQDVNELQVKEAFDLVLCIDVLEMIEKDEDAIRCMFNSLRPNGKILLTVNRCLEKDMAKSRQGQKRRGYTKAHIKEVLKEAGFNRVKFHYSGGPLGRTSQEIAVNIPLKALEVSRIFILFLPVYYLFVLPISAVLNWLDSKTAHGTGQGIILQAQRP
jgi:ubiquinone/menaquinone biosynthesis C-methylase UbiE